VILANFFVELSARSRKVLLYILVAVLKFASNFIQNNNPCKEIAERRFSFYQLQNGAPSKNFEEIFVGPPLRLVEVRSN